MRTVHDYCDQIREEIINANIKRGMKSQCTEMGCKVNFRDNLEFDIKSLSKDLLKQNALNW
jgi:hypothetical protein